MRQAEWPHASMQVPDPQRDTTRCKKKPNEVPQKKSNGMWLNVPCIWYTDTAGFKSFKLFCPDRCQTDVRLLPVIPGQNASTNLAAFGSSPVPLFKRLKSPAFMELPIQSQFSATFVKQLKSYFSWPYRGDGIILIWLSKHQQNIQFSPHHSKRMLCRHVTHYLRWKFVFARCKHWSVFYFFSFIYVSIAKISI